MPLRDFVNKPPICCAPRKQEYCSDLSLAQGMFSCFKGPFRSTRKSRRRNRRNRASIQAPATTGARPAASAAQEPNAPLELYVSDVTHEIGSHDTDQTSDNSRRVVSALIDCSFSMLPLWDDIRSGYADFLAEQKQRPGQAVYSLRLFDTMSRELYSFAGPSQAGPIPESCNPRGSTALADNVCTEIARIGKFMQRNPGFDQVTLLVLTDGRENMSNFGASFEQVMAECVSRGWEVVLGVNGDIMEIASRVGVQGVMHYDLGHLKSAYSYATRDSDSCDRTDPLDEEIMDLSTGFRSESLGAMSAF